MRQRLDMTVTGCVQGVGFRPFVHRLATALGLAGRVRNTPRGVRIELEGPPERLAEFRRRLAAEHPPQARLDGVEVQEGGAPSGIAGFTILPSERSGDVAAGMPPDLATCEDCRRELFDPADRRYRYPFLNCTHCGPRFTIIAALPYDRERTAMQGFAMCPDCRREYEDPADRRFDAQPTACAACGPRLGFSDCSAGVGAASDVTGEAALAEFVRRIRAGGIGAVKGLGGFHLCCRADAGEPVARLRERKHRPHKPLAVMFRDLEQLRSHCAVSAAEEEWLLSPARPVVVLAPAAGPEGGRLSPLISPDTGEIGAFLPYTPLHHLLLAEVGPLVMTSANRAEEPISITRAELEENGLLGADGVAEFVLDHDRPILRRCDDSVVQVTAGGPVFLRRSRGFVPQPVALPISGPPVLACGGDVKNVFAVSRGNQLFLSQHVGDLAEPAAHDFFRAASGDLARLLGVAPEVVACDLHPAYFSSRLGRELAGGAAGSPRLVEIQHHHAHIAAVLAEHGRRGPVIGVALDGTGYGPDGTVWGGEFMVADLAGYERVAHVRSVPMPGGEAAVQEPARMALGWLHAMHGPEKAAALAAHVLPSLPPAARTLLLKLCGDRAFAPLTSSAGRLFDAAAALLGFAEPVTYEGQAAIRMQALAEQAAETAPAPAWAGGAAWEPPPAVHSGVPQTPRVVDFAPVLAGMLTDLAAGVPRAEIARNFHLAVAASALAVCRQVRAATGLDTVALSGGVFQNRLLLGMMENLLAGDGFVVLRHRLTSPNDSCLALGQAAVALARSAAAAGGTGSVSPGGVT